MLPSELLVGDTWSWEDDYSDYPAGTWTATAYFVSALAAFSIVATADGTTHSFDVTAATSSGYVADRYSVTVRVTDGTTITTVDDGLVNVLPDPTKQRDTRTWARRTLEAIECFLAGNATTAQMSMTLRDRSISRWPLAELMQWRDKLRGEVRAEEGTSNGLGRDIKVRFGRG